MHFPYTPDLRPKPKPHSGLHPNCSVEGLRVWAHLPKSDVFASRPPGGDLQRPVAKGSRVQGWGWEDLALGVAVLTGLEVSGRSSSANP